MIKINIICIGKLKEDYYKGAETEYKKRMTKYADIKILELKEAYLPKNPSKKDEICVMEAEGKEILKRIKKDDLIITLEISGKLITSEQLANKIEESQKDLKGDITFIIGGSLGLSDKVKKISDFSFSLSRLTFTHQMARIILLEQIYRSFKINRGETYHK